jgi:hypothetical protein
MRGIARNYQIDFEAIGGTANHVHILLALPPKLSLSDAMRALKANSSKWMNENGHRFAWQEGYAALSVSASNLQQVAAYVRNQPEHHRNRTFEEELLVLLKKHGIEAHPRAGFCGRCRPPGSFSFSTAFPALTRWAHTNAALTGSS